MTGSQLYWAVRCATCGGMISLALIQFDPDGIAHVTWTMEPFQAQCGLCRAVKEPEIGVEMKQFPTAQHLASWAALCPGNHESAGKRKSGKTRDGNKWLRRSLCQAAWAASRAKDCCLATQFKRLAARRGLKRALMAVAHTLLVIGYHILKRGEGYRAKQKRRNNGQCSERCPQSAAESINHLNGPSNATCLSGGPGRRHGARR